MLDPKYLEKFSDQLLGIIDALVIAIIDDMAKRIVKTGSITDSTKHQAEILQNAGLVYMDTITRVSQVSGYQKREVERMYQEAGIKNLKNESVYYRQAGKDVIELKQSGGMQRILQANVRKTCQELDNLTMTTAVKSQSAYIQACNRAQMKVSTGAFSYDKAIADAIKEAAVQGTEVLYPTQHVDKLDVAVRRAVLTGVNQTAAELNLQYAKEAGCDYVETTAHSGARPSHAVWQGKVFCLSGMDSSYSNFYEATGYGTGPGLCGWNCRHNFHAYFPGISTPGYTKEMLDDYSKKNVNYNGGQYTEYEASQMQRGHERQIRETKRKLAGYNAAINETEDNTLKNTLQDRFNKESIKLKKQEAALKDFCRETGRRYESARVRVHAVKDTKGNIVGFNRSVAQKAVWVVRPKRKSRNIGEFKDLQIPMQKRQIKRISRKYGLKIDDLILKIQRNREMVNLPFFGSTDYDNIGRIDLFPSAFTSEEELVRTIIHERCHVLQLRKYGKNYTQNNLDLMEQQAYKFEEFWYNVVRKRVRT